MKTLLSSYPARRPHPAFDMAEAGLEDADTGISVHVVRYRDNHPDYVGGRFVEVYDGEGDLLDGDFGEPEQELAALLADAVTEFEDEVQP
ncbi:MAG: hypothetical protein JRD89_03470 [Deltaproteobacteria bacterium]|nr:hypothetical protein [Deltaproteobacteria bacterium]